MEKERRRTVGSLIAAQDVFGHQIKLTPVDSHRKSDSFKTIPGGIMSIIQMLLILTYFLTQVIAVFQNESSLKQQQTVRNLQEYPEMFHLNRDNFDFAIKLDYVVGIPEISNNLEQYLTVKVFSLNISWIEEDGVVKRVQNPIERELELCPADRFKNTTSFVQGRRIANNYLCTKDTDYQLQGQLANIESQSILIQVFPCNAFTSPGTDCKSQQEIDAIISDVEVYVPYMGLYFDDQEYSDYPLKPQFQDYAVKLGRDLSIIEVMKVQLGDIILKDDKWFNSINNKNFTYVNAASFQQSVTRPSQVAGYTNLYFIQDQNKFTITRTAYTVQDAISNTGGIISFIALFFAFIVKRYTENAYYADIISSIFLQETEDNAESIKSQLTFQNPSRLASVTPIELLAEAQQKSEFDSHTPQQFNFNKKAGIQSKPNNVGPPPKKKQPTKNESFQAMMEQEFVTENLDSKQILMQRLGQHTLNRFVERVTQQLEKRQNFRIFTLDLVKMLYCVCRKNSEVKERLFERGKKKLQKEFEITRLLKMLRNVKLLQQILLSKYQLRLSPYFSKNVLKVKNKKAAQKHSKEQCNDNETQKEGKDLKRENKLRESVQLLVEKSEKSKIDKRILKNLSLLDERKQNMTLEDYFPAEERKSFPQFT